MRLLYSRVGGLEFLLVMGEGLSWKTQLAEFTCQVLESKRNPGRLQLDLARSSSMSSLKP